MVEALEIASRSVNASILPSFTCVVTDPVYSQGGSNNLITPRVFPSCQLLYKHRIEASSGQGLNW